MSDPERIAQLEDMLTRERRAAAQHQDRLLEEIRVHQIRAEQFKRERDTLQQQIDSHALQS